MKLIVGNMNELMRSFIVKYQFKDKIKVINKMCNVKTIYETVDVIIPFGIVEPTGLISSTNVPLEELLMSVKVNKVIFFNKKAYDKISQIANKYGIIFEMRDLNSRNKTL